MNKWIKDAVKLLKPIEEKNKEYLKIRKKSIIMEDDYWNAVVSMNKEGNVVKAIMRILKSNLEMEEFERDALATHVWELVKQKKYLKTMVYVITGDNGTWKYADSDIANDVRLMVEETITKIDAVLYNGFNEYYKTLEEEFKIEMIEDFLFKYKDEIWKVDAVESIAEWVAKKLKTRISYEYIYRYW